MKTCSKCKQDKDLSCFSKDKQKKSGIRPDCKECQKARVQLYDIENPDKTKFRKMKYNKDNKHKVRGYMLKTRYGLSVAAYEAMVIDQNGLCAICEQSSSLVVDHNHKTGKIRGLLCGTCNRALGLLKDSSTICTRAAEYILKEESQG